MRKQTKLVAVLSAAALLALGASMTSFAAGWEKDEAGVWHFYDEDDELVTGEWKKDGGKWFYLDDDGDMLTDSWVDGEYYVGEDGAMLVNQWIKTYADEDIDDPEDDEESWFYFGSKGKLVENGDKKINGKVYYFEEGKMQDGWYSPDGGETTYYLGDEDDGARKSGWLWLEMPDDDVVEGHDDDESSICDEEGWYYFGSNGKMYKEAAKKRVNGRYYYFNNHGQMLYEWINGAKVDDATPVNAVLDGKTENASPSDMIYTNVVEEGWRADGWYEIEGSEDLGTNEDTDWYYFKDGVAKKATEEDSTPVLTTKNVALKRARIKINGKWFCFNEKGQMQTGLQWIGGKDGATYYFDEDGYMKTGKIASVDEENDSFTYSFQTKNGGNGKGVTGVKDGYLYWNGKRLEADDDYRIYKLPAEAEGKWNYYLVNNKGKVQKSESKDYNVEVVNKEDLNFFFDGNVIEQADADGAEYDYMTTVEKAAVAPAIYLENTKITLDDKGVTTFVKVK